MPMFQRTIHPALRAPPVKGFTHDKDIAKKAASLAESLMITEVCSPHRPSVLKCLT